MKNCTSQNSHFQELQIEFSQYEQPVVLTVEAQEKYDGNLSGWLSKILFLKDKKNWFYIVSALTDTKVDLKVLSQRLGLEQGGLRMAPEEALGEILQGLEHVQVFLQTIMHNHGKSLT